MNKWLLALFLVFSTRVSFVAAQNPSPPAPPSCSTPEWRGKYMQAISWLEEQVANLQTEADALDLLIAAEATLDNLRYECVTQVFSSIDFPNGVVGPFYLTGTLYEVTFSVPEAGGYDSATGVTVAGSCPIMLMQILVSSVDIGTEQQETDLVQANGDCMYMLEVNSDADWTIEFTRIR